MNFCYRFGYKLGRKVRFFIQRCKRGFDDSETWDLEDTFYRWLLPRLRRFKEVTMAYPMSYKSHTDWKKELSDRVAQLDCIVNIDDISFQDWSYIPKNVLRELHKKCVGKSSICSTAKDYCIKDFNKWFCKNVGKLWW